MAKQTTLAEKLYAILSNEQDDDQPLSLSHTFPWTAGEYLTEFELDCRDWGFVFGLAYGIARGEDPYESTGSVSLRAIGAAIEAHKKWAGDDIFSTEAFAKDRSRRPVPIEVA